VTLRRYIALAIVAVVGATVLLSWVLTSGAVLRPLAREVHQEHLETAVYIAEQVEQGQDPEELGRALGLSARFIEGPPPDAPSGRRWGPHSTEYEGRPIHYPPDRRNVIGVRTEAGWIAVRRELDLGRPGRRLLPALLLVGLAVVGVAGALGRLAVRPLDTVRVGMDRIAGGDLDHRLQVRRGPAELREVATTFNAMADRLEGMLRAEKELMAGVSHDLRTPLTRLQLELALLEDQAPERVEAMRADLDELDGLIEQLLQISRLELGQIDLDPRPLDLHQLALEAGPDEVLGQAFELDGDPSLMVRALSNLVQNARRHAPGAPVRIRFEGRALLVEDEGPGVPEAQRERLFEPFYRVEGSRSRTTGGSGLGLMIVRQVVRLHGGKATAEPGPAGGLRIRLEFEGPWA
jgi:signal transduction histidine kinase